jgi:hypothetical protein
VKLTGADRGAWERWRHTHRSRLIALFYLRAIQLALGDGSTPRYYDEALERDLHAQKFESPGSYGLCWRLFTGQDGWPMNCTKFPGHDGDCGREEGA